MDCPITNFGLAGRIAVVTGGARRLGNRMARALASQGAAVAILSRNEQDAAQAAEELASTYDVPAVGLAADVTSPASLASAREMITARLGTPDILVNNAGGTLGASPRHLFERDPEDIRAMIEVNLLGTILATREFGPGMVGKGYGKIINVASVAGLIGRDRRVYQQAGLAPQPVEYAASKAGVIGFTIDCAGLLGPDGVRVNAISPGGFARETMLPAFREAYSERTALGRMGDIPGSDLDGAVIYLASAASDYVTGHNLVVDGGFSFWK